MKRKYVYITLTICSVIFASCKKELEEKFNNPENTSETSIAGFFTSMLNNEKVRPSYYNVRTFLLQEPGKFSQTNFFYNANDIYRHDDGYIGTYWKEFYHTSYDNDRQITLNGVMALYRLMEKAYRETSEADQAKYDLFMQAGRIILIYHASQLVDLWGDIPYSETGSLETSSTVNNAKFDDQKELYMEFISDLTAAATYFSDATATAQFNSYDIMLGGDTHKWRKFANALKLRLLMRISFYDESSAKQSVMEMLSNAAQYPLVDGDNVGSYNPQTEDIIIQPLTDYTGNLNNAIMEGGTYAAPDYLLNKVLLPVNDPRIPVLFDRYGKTENGVFKPNKEYKALAVNATVNDQETNWSSYSTWDSVTFLVNSKLPGIMITASEVNFLKAEAEQRWGNESNAKTDYETALRQSIVFYYYLNSTNTAYANRRETVPTDAAITAFIRNEQVAYTGSSNDKLAKIWTQKWAHFGFLQSPQAWAEYRRTKYPLLNFPTEGKLQGYRTPPNRLVYPSSETGYNPNYQAVQSKDTRDNKIFWDVK
ncbi:SusD/RagB family nutrient-binding outer membrane lipoprotein [Olivibacter ginsenosidimutans]